MNKITCIVEGHGEISSLPLLLRRLAEWRSNSLWISIERPIRVKRDRFLNRDEEFRRYILLAAEKSGPHGLIMILLDADDDCPVELAQKILERAHDLLPDHKVSAVIANREYEAWFIASAASLHGSRGLHINTADLNIDPDAPRDAKGWISRRMNGNTYGPMTDQPALTQIMDLQVAYDRSRSFRKLCSEWDTHFTAS